MKKFAACPMIILAVALCIPALDAQLADSPWPMFRQNLLHAGRSSYSFPDRPELAWSYQTGGGVDSSPSLGSDGRVYAGSNDNTFYVVESSGVLAWSYRANDYVMSSAALGSDGRVCVGSGYNYDDDTRLYVLTSSGALAWSYAAPHNIRSSPAIGTDGKVYVGCSGFSGTLYSFNSNGSLAWAFGTSGQIYSSPAVGTDGVVYVGSYDCNVYAVDSNGALRWSYLTSGGFGTGVFSSPAVGNDGGVYIGSAVNNLYALDATGGLKWTYATGGTRTSPALGAGDTVYHGSDSLYAIASSGALNWSYATGFITSPTLGGDGKMCAGSDDYGFIAFTSSGALAWTYAIAASGYSSPGIGSDGRILIGAGTRIVCLGAAATPTVTPTGQTPTPTSTPTQTPTGTPGAPTATPAVPTHTPSPVSPTATPTPPIDLTADKTEFGTTDSISVTADVWPLTVPCHPFVRIQMADGSTLWYAAGKGFSTSPVPYLGFAAGPITTSAPILGYPALSANFSGIAAGTSYLEGGAVDAAKTTSADNLVYWGAVDRETLTVR